MSQNANLSSSQGKYNPNQDLEERRNLRAKYRELVRDTKGMKNFGYQPIWIVIYSFYLGVGSLFLHRKQGNIFRAFMSGII